MQSLFKTSLFVTLIMLASACGGDKGNKELTEKNEKLEKYKKEQADINSKIKLLEADLAKTDTANKKEDKAKLVVLDTLSMQNFTHYIELQGRVDAQNISYISSRGAPAQIRAVYVKQGDYVRKGQLLLKLDDAIIRQGVATARQGMAATRNQLDLAKSLYQRTKNLWDQHIGTEVQLLQAKTNVEVLENSLKTQQANVRTAEEQLATTTVVSNVSGYADIVTVHPGETFPSMTGQIKIVNTTDLKVVTDVPENYLSRVKKGIPVIITVPDAGKTFNSVISVLSQSIGTTTKGFTAEAKVPNDKSLKPNLTAMIKIQDYNAPNAVTVPVNILQTDEQGKFVLVVAKEGTTRVARKRPVQVGELYGDKIEVKGGLAAGDVIISEGFQGLYDGQLITTI